MGRGSPGGDGGIHQVKCRICSTIEGRDKLLVPKIDGLWKHAGRRKASKDMVIRGVKVKPGEYYFIQSNQHVKNEKLYMSRPRDSVASQVEHQLSLERKKKLVQLQCLFHILSSGQAMSDYRHLEVLCSELEVPNNLVKHWSESSGWELARAMGRVLQKATQREMCVSQFVSVSADEVTAFNNSQYLSVHGYVVKDWKRVPILLAVAKIMNGQSAENLHEMIHSQVRYHSDLKDFELAEKLVCFSVDGAAVFQGCRSGVIQLLKEQMAPYVFGVHCCAHRTNLAVQRLSDLQIVEKIEKVVNSVYKYFHKSPKKYCEFQSLAEELELQARPMLRDFKIRWISLISPMERVQQCYQLLIAKMALDEGECRAARKSKELLLDLMMLLSLPALMPLFHAVNNLVKFAQSRSTYICDFVSAVKICQADIYRMYVDPATMFIGDEFQRWNDVLADHSYLFVHEWRADMNTNVEYLSLHVGEHSYETHTLVGGYPKPVSRADFDSVISEVKDECSAAGVRLIAELDTRFPDVDLLNAFGIVFPHYWVQPNCDEAFQTHLQVLKVAFCDMRCCLHGEAPVPELRTSREVKAPLNAASLDSQAAMFKITMKANSAKCLEDKTDIHNPFQRLWKSFSLSNLLCSRITEYFRVAQLAAVTLVGSVEDERTFSTLSFIRSKLRNKLEKNLELTIKIFSQDLYTLSTFPYQEAFDEWQAYGERMGTAI